MKSINLIMALCFLFYFSNAQSTEKVDTASRDLNIEVEANYLRHYVWRGANFGNDDVTQSFVNVAYKKFSVNFSVNANLFPSKLSSEFYTKKVMYDEQDVQFTYTDQFKKLNYEVGFFSYFYFHQMHSPSTSELSLKLSYPLNEHLAIITEDVTDVRSHQKLFYTCNGLDITFTLLKKIDLDWAIYNGSGNRYFNQAYYAETNNQWMNYTGSHLSANYSLQHNWYLKFFAEYNLYTSKNIIDFTGINHTSNFSFAVGKDLSIHFNKYIKPKF